MAFIKKIKVNDTIYDLRPSYSNQEDYIEKNKVFAAPTNQSGEPNFRLLDASDIPASIARVASPTFTGAPTAPTPTNGDNSTNIATTAFVQAAINGIGAAANALRYKGIVSLEEPLPSTYAVGDVYKVAAPGPYVGQDCEVGDMLICIKECTNALNASDNDWNVIQVNETGTLSGPNSSTNNNLAAFDGTTGNVIKDSGKSISSDTVSSNSTNDTIPTSKAVYDYVNGQGFAIANNLNLGAAAQKGIVNDILENDSSTNLPTSKAVYDFVIGQSYLTSSDLSLGEAAEKNVDTTLTGKSNSTNLPTSKAVLDYGFMTQSDVSNYLTDNNYLTTNNVTIGAAAAKGIDTSISDEATNNNVPTSLAVYEFVNDFDFSSLIVDEKVKQTNTTNNNTYNLLFSYSASTTTEKIEGTYKSSNLLYNPSSNNLTVGKINDYTLGAACEKGVTSQVTSGSDDLITSGAIYSQNYVTANSSQALTNKTYNGYTLNDACSYSVTTNYQNISSSATSSIPTSAAVYNYIDGLGLTNVPPAPIVRTTSSITSSTSYVTLNFNTSISTMSEGQLLFVTLSAALTSTKYARLSVGGNYLKIYVNSSDYLYASYPANTVLGLVYIDGKLIMINPPIAG